MLAVAAIGAAFALGHSRGRFDGYHEQQMKKQESPNLGYYNNTTGTVALGSKRDKHYGHKDNGFYELMRERNIQQEQRAMNSVAKHFGSGQASKPVHFRPTVNQLPRDDTRGEHAQAAHEASEGTAKDDIQNYVRQAEQAHAHAKVNRR